MNNNYTIQKARILLRKDATSNWESNLGQVLGNGEVAFLEPVPGDSIGRMIVGDGANNLRTLINSETSVAGGDYSSMEFASWLDPLERSRLHAVFYSGIGAGYTLPTASSNLLGGIKIDNSMFKMDGDYLKLSQFEVRYEEGKGYVIHIPNSNLEVDNTLYVHTLKSTDHYKDLGLFVDLNKKITDEVITLVNQTWRFYEQLNNRDLTNIEMIDIPFTVKIPVDENNFEDIKYNSIFITDESILFVGADGSTFVAYSKGAWESEHFRTIIFDNNATIVNYKNVDYINRLLELGYPTKDELTPNPLPLNTADRLFGGVVLQNYRYDDNDNRIGPHHGFLGLNYDGIPLYSRDFNVDYPQSTYDIHYLLHSGTDILGGLNKNRILKIDENGTEVIPTFFVEELNSRIKSDGKIQLQITPPTEDGNNQGSIVFNHGKITKFTPKTTSGLPNTLISAVEYDVYGHITNYTTDAYCINRIKDTYTKQETDNKIKTVSDNVSDLNQKVDSWDGKWQDRVKSITQGTQIQVTSEGSNDGTTFTISHGSVGKSASSRGGVGNILRSISWDENGHVVECVAESRDAFVLKQDTDYQNLLNDYNTLKSQYDDLLARITALETPETPR